MTAIKPANTTEVMKAKPKTMHGSITANLSGTINVASDELICDAMYMSMIGDDKLAIADHNNKAIKIVDLRHQRVVADIKLPYLWDIVLLDDEEQLAVTLPTKHVIQFLSISDDRLSKVRQLKVEGMCVGLAYYHHNLLVTFTGARGKIQIMTLEGNVLVTILATPFGESVFNSPYYIAVDQQNRCIYASDWQKEYNRITRMSLGGEVTGVYKDRTLNHPSGMVVLVDGSLLVCSQRTNTIPLISSDLINSRPLLQEKDEVKDPNCVALNREQNKLYVGNHHSDYIQVYDLK